MRAGNYPRVLRALFCSALLLSQHAVVHANNWATGRASSSRSSTLAVMQPGGRNRPIRDWKAIKRESEEKLNKQAEEKAKEKAREAGGLVEAVQDKVEEVLDEHIGQLETASAESLDLEESTPETLGIMLAKVVVIATAGVYGAKKAVAFAKAFMKARKDRKGGATDGSSPVAATKDGKDDDDNDDQGGEAEVVSGGKEKGDLAAEEEDETTDGFVTADEEEENSSQGASAMLGSMGKAAKDMKKRAKGGLENLKSGIGEATSRGDGDVKGAVEGDSPPSLPKGVEGRKVDVSYV